ncbi:MAG: type II toxin-antitoxin system PemK/MazF family toxin [Actinomycetota bacterium]
MDRRALSVSYEPFHRSGLLTVCPISAARGVRYPQEVGVPAGQAGQTEPGVILCHEIRTISANRIVGVVGHLTDPELRGAVGGRAGHTSGARSRARRGWGTRERGLRPVRLGERRGYSFMCGLAHPVRKSIASSSTSSSSDRPSDRKRLRSDSS